MTIHRARRISKPFKVHLRRDGKEAWCGRKLSHGGLRSLDRFSNSVTCQPCIQAYH